MQVSDLVNLYQNSVGAGSKIQTKTKGVEKLVKTVSSMEKGQVFEGTVKSIKGDKVVLSLSNGQNISARLDKGMGLTQGQSIFFQVKSNEGGTIAIKPFDSQIAGNLTLLEALKSAGLPQTEKNLNMVNAMMKEQMPIDKASIKEMVNLARQYPSADIETLVSMKKTNLPISEGMISQFENYKENEGAVLKMVGQLSENITEMLSSDNVSKEEAIGFTKQLVDILSADSTKEGGVVQQGVVNTTEEAAQTGKAINQIISQENTDSLMSITGESKEPKGAEGAKAIAADAGIQAEAIEQNETNAVRSQESLNKGAAPTIQDTTKPQEFIKLQDMQELPRDSVFRNLSPEDSVKLNNQLKELPGFAEANRKIIDDNGNLKPEVKTQEVLKAVTDYFASSPDMSKNDLVKMMESSPFKSMINKLMENAWTIEPKDLTEKKAVDKLYEKIEEDIDKIINLSKNVSKSDSNPVTASAMGVKDNISFIREVNQLYQYVQIPLQMSGEHTTGELYVYSNKKQKRSPDDPLTAFLHFDMDNLGSTDISVKLLGKKVDTKFFLEDDISFQLIEKHLPDLEEKLKALGYNASLTVENDSKKVNFVEDFLKQDAKSAGDIHRYSFDVRA